MYLLRLIKSYPQCGVYKIIESNFPNAQLLLWFLDDYGGNFERIRTVIEDSSLDGWTGNSTALDKKENDIIAISYLFDDKEIYAELKWSVLFTIMKEYEKIHKKSYKEIIIEFDDVDAKITTL